MCIRDSSDPPHTAGPFCWFFRCRLRCMYRAISHIRVTPCGQVACGAHHSLAVSETAEGERVVWQWGKLGPTAPDSPFPNPVLELDTVHASQAARPPGPWHCV